MSDLVDRTRRYLAAFSARDVEALGACLADAVTLRDWDVGLVSGKAAVLAVNAKIFGSVTTLEARPRAIHLSGRTTVSELEIHVNGALALLVADVIDFDDAGLITAVRAYRGT